MTEDILDKNEWEKAESDFYTKERITQYYLKLEDKRLNELEKEDITNIARGVETNRMIRSRVFNQTINKALREYSNFSEKVILQGPQALNKHEREVLNKLTSAKREYDELSKCADFDLMQFYTVYAGLESLYTQARTVLPPAESEKRIIYDEALRLGLLNPERIGYSIIRTKGRWGMSGKERMLVEEGLKNSDLDLDQIIEAEKKFLKSRGLPLAKREAAEQGYENIHPRFKNMLEIAAKYDLIKDPKDLSSAPKFL